jgi:hypothetical protein
MTAEIESLYTDDFIVTGTGCEPSTAERRPRFSHIPTTVRGYAEDTEHCCFGVVCTSRGTITYPYGKVLIQIIMTYDHEGRQLT